MAKLYFYYAAMNAGKSTNLLQSSHNYHERGMDTIIFTPELDNRYQVGEIHSRIGLNAKASIFNSEFDFYQYVSSRSPTPSCLLIDEAQFLTKSQVQQLSEVVDTCHIPVIAYGLRTDFQGEPFEGSQYLLAWADELSEIKTICHCGAKAIMNMRINAAGEKVLEGDQIFIGGNRDYVATCRKHYKLGVSQQQPAKDDVSTSQSLN